jgi:hypothetical protein
MTLNNMCQAIVTASLTLCVLCANEARAQLGTTLPVPRIGDGVQQRVLLTGAFRVRSSIDPGGTTINEYATNAGIVFAYMWQGPTMPDLTQLLGRYAESYRLNAASRLAALGNLHASRVEQPDVIVESGGQMRSYVGRAWMPDAIPPGVSLSDLQ